MRFVALLLLAGCASTPAAPDCPDLPRIPTATEAAPKGLTAGERAYWQLAVEWRGEALTEAAIGDAAKQDVRRLRSEVAEARAAEEAKVEVFTVVLWVVGAALVGFGAGALVIALP